MAGSILYPFNNIHEAGFEKTWVMELARRINFQLILFTCLANKNITRIPSKSKNNSNDLRNNDRLIHSQKPIFNTDRPQSKIVYYVAPDDKTKQFSQIFIEHIQKIDYSFIVLQPNVFDNAELNFILDVIQKPVLVLPHDHLMHSTSWIKMKWDITERFYEIFRHVETYHIDYHIFNYIFNSLAKDKNLPNYLRRFFIRNRLN